MVRENQFREEGREGAQRAGRRHCGFGLSEVRGGEGVAEGAMALCKPEMLVTPEKISSATILKVWGGGGFFPSDPVEGNGTNGNGNGNGGNEHVSLQN